MIEKANEISSRTDPITNKAPNIDRITETPQSPGFPIPNASSPSENQFFDVANLVATYAFATFTMAIAMNNLRGFCKATTFNDPNSKPPVTTCIPNQMLEDAIPRDARLPEDL